MPWQQHVADVALEVDPETGLLVYREVVLTVPRQSGKTALLLSVMVHRAQSFGGDQQIKYTAQTRNDARQKWEDEHVKTLKRSAFKSLFTVRLTNGGEAIKWSNGSMHGITASGEKAGHGATLDLGVIDEAFAHQDASLEQGLRPTMITRPQPQLWVPSTAGTAKSSYLRGKVDNGRARCNLGLTSDTAYFEWSAEPGSDPEDPATWWTCMPALGHIRPDGTGITEKSIRADLVGMGLKEFRRPYLNQWPDDAPEEWLVIPRAAWESLADPGGQMLRPGAFAVDVTPERSYASLAVAGFRADGRVQGEIADHHRGTGWVVERAVQLKERWGPLPFIVDAAGPAGSLIGPLEAAGIEVTTPTTRDACHAAQGLYDACCDSGDFVHLDDPVLTAALAGAQKRPLGDAWLWARKGLSVDISPLVAITNVRWGLLTAPIPEPVRAPVTAPAAKPGAGPNMFRPTSRLKL